MSAILNVIGIVAGAASLVPYLSTFFAPDPKDNTKVRIVLGTSTDDAASFGGNIPGASLWDFKGSAIGFTDGNKDILPQGSFVDITITPRAAAGNIQAEYVSISNGGNDAICIAGLALTFPDGARAGFSTNIAAACGAFWSNSHTPVLQQPASGEVENPKCIWLDRDGSNGIPHQGMGIHLPSFSNTNKNLGSSYTRNRDLMCKSAPRFHMYPQLKTEDSILVFPQPLAFNTDSDDPEMIGTDQDPGLIVDNPGVLTASLIKGAAGKAGRRRDARRHDRLPGSAASNNTIGSSSLNITQALPRRPMAELLIISPHTFNSARELCESWNSFGHSFVSLPENLFCDMTDKSLYYTCSDKVTSCCFDTDKESFRSCHKKSTRPPISQVNGTSAHSVGLRNRQASNPLDTSWLKGNKTYDSVQRWS